MIDLITNLWIERERKQKGNGKGERRGKERREKEKKRKKPLQNSSISLKSGIIQRFLPSIHRIVNGEKDKN